MKRLFIVSILILFIGCNFLSASDLIVRLFDGSDISITFDGKRYLSTNGSVSLKKVRGGEHQIEIFKTFRNGYDFLEKRIYFGVLNIQNNDVIIVEVDEYNNLNISAKNTNYGRNYTNNNHNENFNGHPQRSFVNPPQPMEMDPQSFSMLMERLDVESFDEKRLEIARFSISNTVISSLQLQKVLRKFSFDDNRLNLAKQVYQFVSDKNNIFVIESAFSFSSNADSFFKFIGAR